MCLESVKVTTLANPPQVESTRKVSSSSREGVATHHAVPAWLTAGVGGDGASEPGDARRGLSSSGAGISVDASGVEISVGGLGPGLAVDTSAIGRSLNFW